MDLLDRLDPELAAGLLALPAGVPIDWDDLSATRAARARAFAAASAGQPASPGVAREDRAVPGRDGAPAVPVRLYRPVGAAGPLPALLWVHGGGYVLGSVAITDPVAAHLAEAVGCFVVSVEYRLAPEHPFPAALGDCYAALRWVFDQAAALGIDRGRIAVGGPSAGGGLAAGLALLARDRGEVPLACQLLIYPMLDDRSATPSSHAITDSRVWNRAANLRGWRAYLGGEPGGATTPPYAAAARAADLAGLPPAYLAVGTADLFVDEDIAYAQRLIAAGVPTELHVYPGAFHGSEGLIPAAALSRRMVADRDAALVRALRPPTPATVPVR